MPSWTLEVLTFDGSERAAFPSREEALDHARDIIEDYDSSVTVSLIDPDGKLETLQKSVLPSPDGPDD